MTASYHIESHCRITEGRISKDGKSLFESAETEFSAFIKSAYKALEINYSKFFKMDSLSKLALVAAEMLLLDEHEKNMALVFSNKAGSLDTDRKHQHSIQDPDGYYPSPAVFVYTLPNICMGEISIRHGLFSENSFFICNRFRADDLFDYTNSLLGMQKAEKVLCGWIDFDLGKYDAFLYVVAKNGTFIHSKESINHLYQTQ